jgi:nicotinate-nucleotide pyrophosphorylase (carboxylating)
MTIEHVRPDRLTALQAAGLDVGPVLRLIDLALAEDLDSGIDVTSHATIPEGHRSTVDLVARQPGVVAGVEVAAVAFEVVAKGRCAVQVQAQDGDRVSPGDVLLTVTGPTRAILTAERTALNLLGHLCGVATITAAWVDAVAGSGAQVRDTRKTMPGLRALEKHAVRCGGGVNHRMGLFDAALIKDNHVAAAGGVLPAFEAVRDAFPGLPVQVEVDSLEQLAPLLDAGAQEVLLDNFAEADLRAAVALAEGRARLEASGGLSLGSAARVAATGVDSLAVGALTHSAPVLDIGADYREDA